MVKTTLIASLLQFSPAFPFKPGLISPSTIYCMDGIRVLEDLPFCPWGESVNFSDLPLMVGCMPGRSVGRLSNVYITWLSP